MAYYAKAGAEALTCENYQAHLDAYDLDAATSNYSFLNEEAEPWNNPSYCLDDLSANFWKPVNHANTYSIDCMAVTTTEAAVTTTAEVVATTTEAPVETTQAPATLAPLPKPTAMVDDAFDGCCDNHLIDINLLVGSGQPADIGVQLVQYGTNDALGGKHKYSADLTGTGFGSQSKDNGFGSKVFLVPYEHQVNPANCGSSTDVHWAMFFADSDQDLIWHSVSCATHIGANVQIITENIELPEMAIKCPLDIMSSWSPVPDSQTYDFYCGDPVVTQEKR